MKNVVLEFNSNGNDKQKECGKAWANDDIDEVEAFSEWLGVYLESKQPDDEGSTNEVESDGN